MKRVYWFYSFAVVGLIAPLVLLLLQRNGVRVSPFLVVNVWPTFMLAAMGVVGMKGWWLWGFTILLNGICYGAMGFLTAFFLPENLEAKS